MASLNQIAFAFADSVGKGEDHSFVERVKFSIRYLRAKLIRQEAERARLNDGVKQTYIDTLTTVDELDSCVVSSNCNIRRTLNKVPQPVHTKGSAPFVYVGPASFKCPDDIAFIHATAPDVQFMEFNRYNHAIPRYMYLNGYVYIYGDCLRKYVRIISVFENPEDARDKCTTAASCFTDDDEYPIGAHMLDTILRELQSAEMRLMVEDREVPIVAKTA